MSNYIIPNANFDLFLTPSFFVAIETYLKDDAIVKFKSVLDTVTQMHISDI